eukprot:3259032-Lingulodinium_polyedra.AAC.1
MARGNLFAIGVFVGHRCTASRVGQFQVGRSSAMGFRRGRRARYRRGVYHDGEQELRCSIRCCEPAG